MSDSVTQGPAAHQVPRSMGFSRQEYYSGLPCPPPGDLPNPGIKPASLTSPVLAGGFCLRKMREKLIFDDHRARIGRAKICTENHN